MQWAAAQKITENEIRAIPAIVKVSSCFVPLGSGPCSLMSKLAVPCLLSGGKPAFSAFVLFAYTEQFVLSLLHSRH